MPTTPTTAPLRSTVRAALVTASPVVDM